MSERFNDAGILFCLFALALIVWAPSWSSDFLVWSLTVAGLGCVASAAYSGWLDRRRAAADE